MARNRTAAGASGYEDREVAGGTAAKPVKNLETAAPVAVPYCPMDGQNRAPCFAAASCAVCGAYNDLVPTGQSFHCRGEHRWRNWRGDLLAIQELSEPVVF